MLIRPAAVAGLCHSLHAHWRSASVVLTFSAAARAAIPSSPMAFSCKLRQANTVSALSRWGQGNGQQSASRMGYGVPECLGGHTHPALPTRDRGWGRDGAHGGGKGQSNLLTGAHRRMLPTHAYSRLARLPLDCRACARATAACV